MRKRVIPFPKTLHGILGPYNKLYRYILPIGMVGSSQTLSFHPNTSPMYRLDLIRYDRRVAEELWTEVCNIVQ